MGKQSDVGITQFTDTCTNKRMDEKIINVICYETWKCWKGGIYFLIAG